MMLNKITQLALTVAGLAWLAGCAGNLLGHPEYRIWQEEVKLNDGRVIVVTRKKRCEGAYTGQEYAPCIAREAWLTIQLPEFGNQDIVWHESLNPRVVNIHNGKLYVVGWPPTGREFDRYGKQRPPYIGFQFENGQWKRISFAEIPEAIYQSNMLIESFPPADTRILTLTRKESREINGDPTYSKHQKRIDPTYRSNF